MYGWGQLLEAEMGWRRLASAVSHKDRQDNERGKGITK